MSHEKGNPAGNPRATIAIRTLLNGRLRTGASRPYLFLAHALISAFTPKRFGHRTHSRVYTLHSRGNVTNGGNTADNRVFPGYFSGTPKRGYFFTDRHAYYISLFGNGILK